MNDANQQSAATVYPTAAEMAMPFYGPHSCDHCGATVIRASLEAGGRRFDPPGEGERYPNAWTEHRCADPVKQGERAIHKTTPLKVWADVDEGIAEAVRRLNEMPGVRTHGSCQGTISEGGPHPYRAHVQVSWRDDQAFRAIAAEFEVTVSPAGGWGYVYPRNDRSGSCTCQECAKDYENGRLA